MLLCEVKRVSPLTKFDLYREYKYMNKISLAVLAVLIANNAYANTYLGSKLGWGTYDQSSCNGIVDCDNESFSAGAFLGYEFNNYISAELGYDYLGNIKDNFGSSKVDGTLSAITVMPKFTLPVTDRFGVFAKVGGAYMEVDHHDDFVTTGALGAEYKINWNTSVSAEYQHYDVNGGVNSNTDANFVSLGIKYKFGSPKPIYEENLESSIEIRPVEKLLEYTHKETMGTVQFQTSSFDVTNADELSEVVDILTKYPQSNAELVGYSDSTGSNEFNEKLSEERAQATATYLESLGVAQERLEMEGKGDLNPIATNDTSDGRKQNRRVEVKVPAFTYQVTEVGEEEVITEVLVQKDISPNWW